MAAKAAAPPPLVVPDATVQETATHGTAWDTLFAVDTGLSLWTLLTFGAMVLILWRFAWKPLLGALDAREKGIQDAIDEARQQREEAQRLVEEQQAKLAESRRQAQSIVAQSREAADQLRRELETKARKESHAIIEGARREIERERDAAVETLRRESVELAMAAASRLLSERLDDDRDRQLVMSYVDEMSGSGGASGSAGFQA